MTRKPSQADLGGGLVADSRRALWIPTERALVVADLHLGYSWVQRKRGCLLPISAPDDLEARLFELCEAYRPQQIVFLGDLVHAAAPLEPLRKQATALIRQLQASAKLICVLGNHDRGLAHRAQEWALPLECVSRLELGNYNFIHGDSDPTNGKPRPNRAVTIIGHEHPCLSLAGGVASYARTPCFLQAPDCVVLPAFSNWASGCVVGQRPFLGPVARAAIFERAIAVLGDRMLVLPLSPGSFRPPMTPLPGLQASAKALASRGAKKPRPRKNYGSGYPRRKAV